MPFFISLSLQGLRQAGDEYTSDSTEPKCRRQTDRRDRIQHPGWKTKSRSVSPQKQIGKEKSCLEGLIGQLTGNRKPLWSFPEAEFSSRPNRSIRQNAHSTAKMPKSEDGHCGG
jgi:hypothetical protein